MKQLREKYNWFYSLLLIGGVFFIMFYFMMPQTYEESENVNLSEFSTKRALLTVKEISKKPHYVG